MKRYTPILLLLSLLSCTHIYGNTDVLCTNNTDYTMYIDYLVSEGKPKGYLKIDSMDMALGEIPGTDISLSSHISGANNSIPLKLDQSSTTSGQLIVKADGTSINVKVTTVFTALTSLRTKGKLTVTIDPG